MKRILFRAFVLIATLLVGTVLYDLYFPRTAKMREFDPDEVARLETAMWRRSSLTEACITSVKGSG